MRFSCCIDCLEYSSFVVDEHGILEVRCLSRSQNSGGPGRILIAAVCRLRRFSAPPITIPCCGSSSSSSSGYRTICSRHALSPNHPGGVRRDVH
eukprot:gene39-biopygen235